MFIQTLKIKDIEISFDENFSSHAIIGQNGSGKSNLLEALITIFRDLDLNQKASLGYELLYKIRDNTIFIQAESERLPSIQVNGERISATKFSEHSKEYLPSHIFTYYSGKNERIEKLFQAHQKEFLKEMRSGNDTLARRLFYCRGGHSKLVLLAGLLSNDQKFKKILEDLNILELDSALFILKEPNVLKTNLTEIDILEGDNRIWYARGTIINRFLDKLWQIAIAPIDQTVQKLIDFRGRTEKQDRLYLFKKDTEDLLRLSELVGTPEIFFRYAEGAYIGDLIDDVKVSVKYKNTDGIISFDYLSEGELQLLTVLGLMRITSQDHCLFLLDEPDTHLNPI
jgi:predicted ATP-dependent endonuclease of OLD family